MRSAEERLRPSDLADDDAVGTKPQSMANEVAKADSSAPLAVGRSGLEPHHMTSQLQLCSILNRHDPLRGRNLTYEDVEERRLPSARTSGDE